MNSVPIDDTNIPQFVAAVEHQSRFPWDIDLSAAPILNDNNQSALYGYLRDVSSESIFATSVLHILVEERRSLHRTRWSTQCTDKDFKVGDVVKEHVQVNSNSVTGTVT